MDRGLLRSRPRPVVRQRRALAKLAALGDGCERGCQLAQAVRHGARKAWLRARESQRNAWLFRDWPESEREAQPLLAGRLLCRSEQLSVGLMTRLTRLCI